MTLIFRPKPSTIAWKLPRSILTAFDHVVFYEKPLIKFERL